MKNIFMKAYKMKKGKEMDLEFFMTNFKMLFMRENGKKIYFMAKVSFFL